LKQVLPNQAIDALRGSAYFEAALSSFLPEATLKVNSGHDSFEASSTTEEACYQFSFPN
jgi:hypothetical protein